MIVSVTKKDIANGERNFCSRCPVALATSRQTKTKVYVTPEKIWIGYDTYNVPQRVTDWIVNYDNGKPVKPIRFTI